MSKLGGWCSRAFLSVWILLILPLMADAATESAGKVVYVRGQVEVIGQTRKPASLGQILNNGDLIQTGSDGRIAIILADETLLQLDVNSRLRLNEVALNAGWHFIRKAVSRVTSRSSYSLGRGRGWFRNNNKNREIDIRTISGVVGIRGTEVNLQTDDSGAVVITVLEGQVIAGNQFGSVNVRVSEQATALPGRPITKTILLAPEDTVQWTISIPPLYDEHIEPPEVREALTYFNKGEITQTRDRMIDFTERKPDEPAGWTLLALTHVVMGKPRDALVASQKALALAPASINTLVIQSYAQQALFELDKAVESLDRVLQIDSDNVLALVNLARLRFGMGMTEDALGNLEKAARLSTDNSEADNLRGFILLAQRKTEQAITAFQRSCELNPALGEPHMGMALAYMRKGDPARALEEITTAVVLEPRRSVFLSYWGKMLHQLERYDKALDVLKTATRMDPLDPTPELYQALVLRDLNRPTEAIQATNRAVKLNDNRAVYRSRFLLDQDLAVKNVDLSVLYNQLGLSGWARNKAFASVKQDYLNASGHLFLGGALTVDDDRAWPASGEYLLARILQPANFNTFNTFNEYTTFFEKPGIGGTVSGSVGSDSLAGGDFAAYGAIPGYNVAIGTQLTYSETDGWRDTNGQRRSNLAMMAKWDVSDRDTLMAVASYQKSELRDNLVHRFEYDLPSDPEDSLEDRLTRLELGYHRRLSLKSDILFYWSRMDYRGDLFDNQVVGPVDLTARFQRPYDQIQGQYLLHAAGHQIVLGTTQYWGDDKLITDYSVVNLHLDTKKRRYLGSYFLSDSWKVTSRFILDGALYFDEMTNSDSASDTQWKIREWSPRIGIVFTPTTRDTFRLAAFRYLLPFITSRIDPMDIAGVPVFRNAFEGSLVNEADWAWEREWSNGYLSTALFYLERKYEHNVMKGGTETTQADEGRQKGFEILLNQLIGNGFGLAASYRYQDVSEETSPTYDREDHLASIGLRYVHPGGFSSSISQFYRYERFKVAQKSHEQIWLTDARIGYEFPGKRGALSLEMKNIFNHHFNWVTDYFVFTGRVPAREVLLRVSVNF